MTNTNLQTTLAKHKIGAPLFQAISSDALRSTMDDVITRVVVPQRQQKTKTFQVRVTPFRPILESKPKWEDKEYRQAYMESAVHQTIAWQIRINRERRGMTQGELAKRAGTHQSAISRAEDTEYEGHSLATLRKIANAFDCALVVNFVSYSEIAFQSHRLSHNHLTACGYMEEMEATRALQEHRHDTATHSLR